ncbi:MAG TPA: substrate-binding domain-containing protein [Terriglobales bacterium]
MKELRFALLVVENNDFQAQQVIAAQAAADRLRVKLQVIHTEHDSIMQSRQVLDLIQAAPDQRPDAIFFEPVGTALAQPARAAAAAGVGWVVLNRENVEYFTEVRQKYSTPMFSVTASHREVGEIQGQQIGRLLPEGGAVLYIEGPSDNDASVRRTEGMQLAKPHNVEVRILRGRWTGESAYNAVTSWLRLSIAKEVAIGVIAAQNDAMALGARKALADMDNGPLRDRWLKLPFIGCDGLPKSGQAAVRNGSLTATVVIPPNAGEAVELMATALRTGQPAAETFFTQPSSFPPLTSLNPK